MDPEISKISETSVLRKTCGLWVNDCYAVPLMISSRLQEQCEHWSLAFWLSEEWLKGSHYLIEWSQLNMSSNGTCHIIKNIGKCVLDSSYVPGVKLS